MTAPAPTPVRTLHPRTRLHQAVAARDLAAIDTWWTQTTVTPHAQGLLRRALFHTLAVGWEEGARHLLARAPDRLLLLKHWWGLMEASTGPDLASVQQDLFARVPVQLGALWAMAQSTPTVVPALHQLVARGAQSWMSRESFLQLTSTVPSLAAQSGPAWTKLWTPTLRLLPLAYSLDEDKTLSSWLATPPPTVNIAREGLDAVLYKGVMSRGVWRSCLKHLASKNRLDSAWTIWRHRAWSHMEDATTAQRCLEFLDDLAAAGFDLDTGVGVDKSPMDQVRREMDQRKKLPPEVRATLDAWQLQRRLPPQVESGKKAAVRL